LAWRRAQNPAVLSVVHDQAGLAGAHGVVRQPLVQPGGPGGLDVAEEVHHGQDLRAPARRRPALGHPLAQDPHADPLVVGQPDEAERGGHPHRVVELGRLAEAHRGRRVHQQVQAEVFLVHEQLDVEPLESTVDIPVDVAQVVAVAVGTVIGELHAVAATRTAPLALDAAAERAPRQQGQAFQLSKELRGEQARAGGRRHCAYRSSRAWK